MLGRLALGLLGGLGKGAMAAGGGKMALELAKMALGGKGRGAGRGGGTGGRGSQGGGRQQNMPLEELLGALSGEQKARAAGKIPSGRGLPSEPAACALCREGEGTAVMADDNETALRCLAAHIVSFTGALPRGVSVCGIPRCALPLCLMRCGGNCWSIPDCAKRHLMS